MTQEQVESAESELQFRPKSGKARIDVLDYLRGIAILSIFFMNIPFMAGPAWMSQFDPRTMGWSTADRGAWLFVQTYLEGTQRGMLEFLFGAGIMILAARAMKPDGPVAVADLHLRRNLWLLVFGLIDMGVLLWEGDILHVYAVAALIAFPFRTLRAHWLIVLGATMSLVIAGFGIASYIGRSNLESRFQAATAAAEKGVKPNAEATETVKEWTKLENRVGKFDPVFAEVIEKEQKAEKGSFSDYADAHYSAYALLWSFGAPAAWVMEALFGMFLGMAAWKLGFIQGKLSLGTYLKILLIAYGFGLTARYVGFSERLSFAPMPKTLWITQELARHAVTVGHIALVNLLAKTATGLVVLRPFKAAGRMAFTLYFMQQIIGIYIMYSPFGLDLPGGQGWAHLYLQALLVFVLLLIFANLWLLRFRSGPLEWLWRSLAYWKRQPFLKH